MGSGCLQRAGLPLVVRDAHPTSSPAPATGRAPTTAARLSSWQLSSSAPRLQDPQPPRPVERAPCDHASPRIAGTTHAVRSRRLSRETRVRRGPDGRVRPHRVESPWLGTHGSLSRNAPSCALPPRNWQASRIVWGLMHRLGAHVEWARGALLGLAPSRFPRAPHRTRRAPFVTHRALRRC